MFTLEQLNDQHVTTRCFHNTYTQLSVIRMMSNIYHALSDSPYDYQCISKYNRLHVIHYYVKLWVPSERLHTSNKVFLNLVTLPDHLPI